MGKVDPKKSKEIWDEIMASIPREKRKLIAAMIDEVLNDDKLNIEEKLEKIKVLNEELKTFA